MRRIEKEIIINEKNKSGKRVLMISGTHGDESHAVKAVYQLYERLLKGYSEDGLKKYFSRIKSIKFIIGLNESGLVADNREYQELKDSNKKPNDLNRSFRKEDPIERDKIVQDIKEAVAEADIVIDVHNSFHCCPCILVDYDKYTTYMLDTLKNVSELKPIVRAANANAATIKSYTNSFENKLGYTIELPYMGFHEETEDFYYFLEDLLTGLNIPKEIKKTADLITDYKLPVEIIPRMDGIIFWFNKEPLCFYKEGEAIATIKNGEEEEHIYAPCNGTIIDIDRTYIATKGNGIAEMVVE